MKVSSSFSMWILVVLHQISHALGGCDTVAQDTVQKYSMSNSYTKSGATKLQVTVTQMSGSQLTINGITYTTGNFPGYGGNAPLK